MVDKKYDILFSGREWVEISSLPNNLFKGTDVI